MAGLALGMIETKGLVAAIEAADAALKAAEVRLVSSEKVKGAIINIKFVGDVAAVRAAVDAGAAAAGKVGELLAAHVIPSPVEDLDSLIYQIGDKVPENKKPVKTEIESKPDESNNKDAVETDSEEEFSDLESDESGQLSIDYTGLSPEDEQYFEELKTMNVQNLRKAARDTDGLEITGRQISIANKGKLIHELMKKRLGK